MFFTIYFFFSAFILGLAILEFFQIALPGPIKKVLALVLGIILNNLVIFLASLFFGLNIFNSLVLISISFFPSFVFLIFKNESLNIFEDIRFRKNIFIILSLLIISLVITGIFVKSIYQDSSGIIAGNRLVWTDWPVHLAIISSFAKGANFPPQNPLYAGQSISYPFFSDFFSSVLQILGADLKTSLILPGIILGISFLAILYFFGLYLTKKKTAIIGVFVGIFWGGLGFIYFIQDLLNSNFIETLKFPPHEYTFYGEKNLWFFSFLYSELLPQRSFLFGLPMFFIALILLIIGVSHKKNTYLIFSGIIFGIMPFFHMHAFISLLLFLSIFLPLTLITTFKNNGFEKAKEQFLSLTLYFLAPLLGLILIQTPYLLSINTNKIIGFNWGWMKGQENFFLFWFKNTGFFWPLLIFAIWKTKLNPLAKNIAISSMILFILPNIFRFAPWPYDNLKIFTFWYLIGAFFVAESLVFLYKKGLLGKILSILLFLSLILSGVVEDIRIFNTERTKIQIWSQKDIELASTIVEKTRPNSVILTAAVHDHPAAALAGRRIIIGFPGNAWSWGMSDWSQRENDIHTLLEGNTLLTPQLIQKYNIDYVLISPREKYFEPMLNEKYFAENGEQIMQGEDYKLFKLK